MPAIARATEGEGETTGPVGERGDREVREDLRDDGAGVLRPREADLEEGEARLHEEHEERGDQDPDGVDARRGFERVGARAWRRRPARATPAAGGVPPKGRVLFIARPLCSASRADRLSTGRKFAASHPARSGARLDGWTNAPHPGLARWTTGHAPPDHSWPRAQAHGPHSNPERHGRPVAAQRRRPRRHRPDRPRRPGLRLERLLPDRPAPAPAQGRLQAAAGRRWRPAARSTPSSPTPSPPP